MKCIWTQLIATFLLVLVGGTLTTNAFFFDEEGAKSGLGADELDILLHGNPFLGSICAVGDATDTELIVQNVQDYAVAYTVLATNTAGVLCEQLRFKIFINGDRLYDGLIADAAVSEIQLPAHASDTVRLKAYIPTETPIVDGSTCEFTTRVIAHHPDLYPFAGFYDVEERQHQITGLLPAASGDDITVVNDNTATVTNNITVTSSTGGNSAAGGGVIITGDASSSVSVTQTINENTTEIVSSCGCATCGCGSSTSENSDESTTDEEIKPMSPDPEPQTILIQTESEYLQELQATTSSSTKVARGERGERSR